MAWSKMRPANGVMVLDDGRVNPGLAIGMSNLVPFQENVRMDEVLLGLRGPFCARGKDKVGKLIDRTAL